MRGEEREGAEQGDDEKGDNDDKREGSKGLTKQGEWWQQTLIIKKGVILLVTVMLNTSVPYWHKFSQ